MLGGELSHMWKKNKAKEDYTSYRGAKALSGNVSKAIVKYVKMQCKAFWQVPNGTNEEGDTECSILMEHLELN